MIHEKKQSQPAENEVLISRVIAHPREKVFALWADPELLPRWFAPQECTVIFKNLDIRTGGHFHSCIKNPHFKDCWCTGTYLEVTAPEKIVYTIGIADEEGNRRTSAEAGMDPAWPDETLVTVTFKDLGEKTELVIHQAAPMELAKRTGAYPSWLQMLDGMEEQLSEAVATDVR